MKKIILSLLSLLFIGFVVYLLARTCSTKEISTANKKKEYVQDSSTLVIPVRMDIASFEPVFNQQMDEQGWFFEENGIKVNRNLSISFRVKKEGFAQLYPQEGKIQLRIPLFIDIKPKVSGPLSLGIGRDMSLQAKVLLKSAANADIDANWDLVTQAETTFDIQESPELNIAGIKINFEKQLAENLDLGVEEINKQVEEQVKAAINTKEIVNLIWQEIKTPYHVEAEPFDLWAMVSPLEVFASDLKPSGPGEMETSFKVNALVDIKTGKRPLKVNSQKMPTATRLHKFDQKNSTLHFPLVIPFETILDYINGYEEPLSFPIQGNRILTLSNFSATDKDGVVHLQANFVSNDTKGILQMTGTPVFDAESQTISVKINDIKTASNNKVIDQLIAGLQKNKGIRKNIEQQLSYSVKQELADLTFEITNQIKSTRFHEYAKLDGYVNHIKLKDVYVKNQEFLLDTEVDVNLVCLVAAK